MSDYSVSIDLGTTTLAFYDSLGVSYTSQNHQSAFGADVISRIKASCEGFGPLLQKMIQNDIASGVQKLKSLSGLSDTAPAGIIIAANTTMVHLFLGWSCEGLAAFPFSPVSLELTELPEGITFLPGASAFIGGDIISGLLALKADTWEKPCLLLDLGTNGEMVLGTKEHLISVSAAAGPALEGGGISCGVAGIKGAVCHISLDKTPSFQTIGYGRPIGLCGTGIVDLAAQLLSHNLMDETGLLSPAYFATGFPVTPSYGNQNPLTFTQADIRQLQMAKSAVCTGILLLCREYGISPFEIEHLFLAGTFGTQINPDNASLIGLFPKELLSKVQAVGNTSLAGATLFASQPESAKKSIKKIRDSMTCLELANLPEFQKLYISNLNFS